MLFKIYSICSCKYSFKYAVYALRYAFYALEFAIILKMCFFVFSPILIVEM